MTFEIVKANFDKGLWNVAMVKVAVSKGVITAAQFTEITGQTYK